MGYYIETGAAKGKTEALVAKGATEVGPLDSISERPEGMAVVIVVDNGLFEAAGVAFSDSELKEFANHLRPFRTLLMDAQLVRELANVSARIALLSPTPDGSRAISAEDQTRKDHPHEPTQQERCSRKSLACRSGPAARSLHPGGARLDETPTYWSPGIFAPHQRGDPMSREAASAVSCPALGRAVEPSPGCCHGEDHGLGRRARTNPQGTGDSRMKIPARILKGVARRLAREHRGRLSRPSCWPDRPLVAGREPRRLRRRGTDRGRETGRLHRPLHAFLWEERGADHQRIRPGGEGTQHQRTAPRWLGCSTRWDCQPLTAKRRPKLHT